MRFTQFDSAAATSISQAYALGKETFPKNKIEFDNT